MCEIQGWRDKERERETWKVDGERALNDATKSETSISFRNYLCPYIIFCAGNFNRIHGTWLNKHDTT